MNAKRVLAAVGLAVIACFMVSLVTGHVAEAADATATPGNDDMNELMQSKGIEGLFKKKGGPADPRAPKPYQKFIGYGSIVVMILALKYL